jgi:hypothetical protein
MDDYNSEIIFLPLNNLNLSLDLGVFGSFSWLSCH